MAAGLRTGCWGGHVQAPGDPDRSTLHEVVGHEPLQEAPRQRGAGRWGVAGRGSGVQAGLCEVGEELGGERGTVVAGGREGRARAGTRWPSWSGAGAGLRYGRGRACGCRCWLGVHGPV